MTGEPGRRAGLDVAGGFTAWPPAHGQFVNRAVVGGCISRLCGTIGFERTSIQK